MSLLASISADQCSSKNGHPLQRCSLPSQRPAVSGRRVGGRARFRGVLGRSDEPFRQRQARRGRLGRAGGWLEDGFRPEASALPRAPARKGRREAAAGNLRSASGRGLGESLGLPDHAGRHRRTGEVGPGGEGGPRGHGEEARLVVAAGAAAHGFTAGGPVGTGARPLAAARQARLAGARLARLARPRTFGLGAVSRARTPRRVRSSRGCDSVPAQSRRGR